MNEKKFLVLSWHNKSLINGGGMGDGPHRKRSIGDKENNCKNVAIIQEKNDESQR